MSAVILILVLILTFLIGIVALVAYLFCRRKQKRKSRACQDEADEEGNATNLVAVIPPRILNVEDFEVSEEDFQFDENDKLGNGKTGLVFHGHFKPKNLPVAIKTNKEGFSSEIYLKSILQEVKSIIHLGQHEHIVQFYGFCQSALQRGHVYIINELCELGSLETLLRTRRDLFEFWEDAASPISMGAQQRRSKKLSSSSTTATEFPSSRAEPKIQLQQLYKWAFQIADAMSFVSIRKVIHSDLATRNILLSNMDTIKLTDFGLSRRLYEDYHYLRSDDREPLPWKWLDHDALKFGLFTTYTDVWSFGIVLFEIFTLGELPYPDVDYPDEDFVLQLLQGSYQHTQPKYATEELFTLMKKCWISYYKKRPSFNYLKQSLLIMMYNYNAFNND